jgi:hypothetical protein
MEMRSMIKKNLIFVLLALGYILSISCIAEDPMQVFTSPLLQAQPIQSGSGSYMVYPSTSFLEAQPIQSGSGSSDTGTGWNVPVRIDRYDVVQFSHALGDELAAINCYSGGRQIAHLYFMNIDSLPGNFVASGDGGVAVLYYHYNRYNDILDMFENGGELYLIYFDQNNARVERRNIQVPEAH